VEIADVFVLTPDRSSAIALLPDGPGAELGLMMGRTALTPGEPGTDGAATGAQPVPDDQR